ncbi:putative L-type lectin-domain containing receptor kinase VII.2 [Hibiscus syriacus]|uniref:non-specific serine/threonine protein kinase n=1 Tax=Hibiscus syriacus TaxID=106335 RepID=A0A6A2Z375_HIBSY|nr:L-type lectin-domain containing receptor kinase VII.1-like [Hibiscus syriacus]KAE8686414.1 putative L-type lectin-domain containing receptor kinase VII.2 [Hibiscus syriacus]
MKEHRHANPVFSLLLIITVFSQSVLAVDFVFNGFNSTNLLLYGIAQIDSRVLTLTNETSLAVGRALYRSKIPTKTQNSSHVLPFSTSFIFSIAPSRNKDTLPGHGIVFLFTPSTGINGTTSSQHLGLFNLTNNGDPSNRVFGVEFDVFANQEFDDIDDNHVGIDINSLQSTSSHTAGYWPDNENSDFEELKLNDGKNYQVWIDYADSVINVTMALVGVKRPKRPLLNVSLDLSDVFEDEMYVGFTSSTGRLVESHRILSWSFSNSNFALSERLITTGLPSFTIPKTPIHKRSSFIAGVTVASLIVVISISMFSMFLIRRERRKAKERAGMEDWEFEYWPHKMSYQEIDAATNGFSDENVIGFGGNGKVYKGVLQGGTEIAVKRISQVNNGMREFLAEISSLGRLKHRSLVSLKGWCKKEKGTFMLIYYMENGSLDKRVYYDSDETKMLGCEERIRILRDVASALLYLHEGWESKVLHRDIKASNVLLDKDMNARLGDFGLARMHGHGQVATTTRVVGTVGYLAPEVVRTGRSSTQTDVFGFGVLILEVMCGRRPIEDGKPPLVDWVWQLMMQGELRVAVDARLNVNEGLNEVVTKVLHLGLLCSYPNPDSRPTMRQVVIALEGNNEPFEMETEDMETYLLSQVNSRDMWTNYSQSFGYTAHPTYDDIRHSSSISLSWNTGIVDGR